MKAFDVISEKQALIVETHFRKSNLLVESICADLTKDQRFVVEGIYKEFRPLIEATLTPDQINKIFTDVEAGATAAGSNRTMIGKGVDVAGKGVDAVKKANEIINQAGKWLQNTTPVKNFDAKFDKLKNDINTKFPDSKILDGISKMGIWAKENPGKTAAIVGILTAIASLAGGPVGGAVAGQVLRGTVELLKGEKLSTAVGKGIKTAALGYLSGKAFEMLGNWMAGFREQSIPFGPEEAGLEQVSWSATKTLKAPGMEWTQSTKGFNALVRPEEAEAIRNAMAGVKSGDTSAFDSLLKIAREVNSKDYKAGLDDIVQGAWKSAKDNDSLLQFIKTAKEGLQAGSQGAVAASGAMPDKKESRDLSDKDVKRIIEWCDQTPSTILSEGPLDTIKGALGKAGSAISGKASQIGKNLTTKVTADKLNKAWKAAGSPTDSDQVADILRNAGVSDQVLAPVYKSMKLKLAPAAKTDATATTNPVDKTTTSISSGADTEEVLNYKDLQAAVANLRTRDAASLLKYIDSLDKPTAAKPTAPATATKQSVAKAAAKPAATPPAAPAVKPTAVKIPASKPAKPKIKVAV